MKKLWIGTALLGALALIGSSAYLGFRSNPAQATATPEAPPTLAAEFCDVSQTITAPGELVNTNEVDIEMPFNGKLAEVTVQAGDRVEAGQVLAALDGREDYEAAAASANLDVLKAQAALDELKAKAPLEVAQAHVALTEAQIALEDAQEDRDRLDYPRAGTVKIDEAKARLALAQAQAEAAQGRYDGLSELALEDPERAAARLALANAQKEVANALATLNWYLGGPGEAEIARADAALALAQAQLSQAQADWEALQADAESMAVILAEAQLADAQARLATAQEALSQLTITAPFDGIILEANARPGKTTPAGSALFTLNDPQAVAVETTVIEEDLPYVEVGQAAEVYFDALPDETISGTVSRIIPRRAGGDRPLYTVYILLDHVPDKLFAGMSADASVVIAERTGVLCLPRALAQAAADGTATIEVWDGFQVNKRVVEVGLRGDTDVEILSGLAEGEWVVLR